MGLALQVAENRIQNNRWRVFLMPVWLRRQVDAPFRPGMTAPDPAYRKPSPTHGTMLADHHQCIGAACRIEPAVRTDERTDEEFVGINERQHQGSDGFPDDARNHFARFRL